MKNKDLIALLSKLPPDLDVCVYCDDSDLSVQSYFDIKDCCVEYTEFGEFISIEVGE